MPAYSLERKYLTSSAADSYKQVIYVSLSKIAVLRWTSGLQQFHILGLPKIYFTKCCKSMNLKKYHHTDGSIPAFFFRKSIQAGSKLGLMCFFEQVRQADR